MACGIYKITNKANEKFYIGSAVNIDERWRRHKKDLRGNKHHNQYLQRAWDKYGEDNFEFVIVENVIDANLLLEREQYWMDKYNSYNNNVGYNICKVAGSKLGVEVSEETRQKFREARLGWVHSDETKRKISQRNKGKTLSEEHKASISDRAKQQTGERNPFYGKSHSEATKKKISEANKGRKHTQEFKDLISESNKNRIITDDTRKKISESKKKENLSEETLKKLSKANTGENNPNSKLTKEIVIEIKTMLKEGITHKKIAEKFSVSRSLIGNIKNKKIWSHVELED